MVGYEFHLHGAILQNIQIDVLQYEDISRISTIINTNATYQRIQHHIPSRCFMTKHRDVIYRRHILQ